MTSMQIATVTPASAVAVRQPVWKHGLVAAVAAAAVTTVLAVVAKATGVTFADSTGAGIPIAGFAELTLVFSMIGTGVAAMMARRARRPRSTFVRTAVALTGLSYLPDLVSGFSAGSAATLIALHTVAALIVVPALAGRLAR